MFILCVCVQETKGYIESLVGYFKQYTEWVKSSVSTKHMMYIVACGYTLCRKAVYGDEDRLCLQNIQKRTIAVTEQVSRLGFILKMQ